MTALYAALAQLLGTLIVGKIQSDNTSAAARQKLMDSVDQLWDKANAAHIEVQTGVKQNEKAP